MKNKNIKLKDSLLNCSGVRPSPKMGALPALSKRQKILASLFPSTPLFSST